MRKTVPAGEKLAYSGGLVGQNMIYNFMSTYTKDYTMVQNALPE